MSVYGEEFERENRGAHDRFPMKKIEALCELEPGSARTDLALAVLPELIQMARRTLQNRWHSADRPPADSHGVHVHAREIGFGLAFYDPKTKTWTLAGAKGQAVTVYEWRELEGSLAEPWHDQDYGDGKSTEPGSLEPGLGTA